MRTALEWFRRLLRRGLIKIGIVELGPVRKVRMKEEAPSDRFVLIVALMIVFFFGLRA